MLLLMPKFSPAGLRCEIGVAPFSMASPEVGPSHDDDDAACVRNRDQKGSKFTPN